MRKWRLTLVKKDGSRVEVSRSELIMLLEGITKNKLALMDVLIKKPYSIPKFVKIVLGTIKGNALEKRLEFIKEFYQKTGINFGYVDHMEFQSSDGFKYKIAIYNDDFFANFSHLVELYLIVVENRYDVGDVKGKVVIDGGANVGMFSLFCARKGARVYAFEPVSTTYENLLENIRLNRLEKRIYPIKKALGRDKGKAYIEYNESIDTCASFVQKSELNDKKELVLITSLDRVVEDLGVSVDFIKLDIEGFEKEALIGAAKTMKKYKPVLSICAYHKEEDPVVLPQTVKRINPDYSCEIVYRGEKHLYCK